MAVFEKNKSSKVLLDDTLALSCTVETAQNVKDYVEYTIKVQRGPVTATETQWTTYKRYSDFALLDSSLKISGIELPLPPKKVFGNFDREFVAERKQGLQTFLNAVLSNLMLSSSIYTKRFLDERNYATNWQEIALQQVSMFFRSETDWEVLEPLPDIGWRIRKSYFLVRSKTQPKMKYVLSWSDYGPDKFIPEKELSAVMKILPSFQHPYIYPITMSYANENGGLAIRQFNEKGTLRDYIYKAKVKQHFLKKYGQPDSKKITVLQLRDIKNVGVQILETLKYLHEKGLPHGNVHAGNIILENNSIKLLDFENTLLGLPSYYRPYYTQFKKIQSLELIDVYCFGQLLYEMTFGEPLNSSTCYMLPPHCDPQIRSVIESILTTEACKNGLPTVTDLISHSLFSDVILPPTSKPVIKVPSKLKEAIKSGKELMEKRLHEEQKALHQIRRRSKAQSYHMSEEEKKKRRKSKKKSVADDALNEENGVSDVSKSSASTTAPATPTTPTVPATPPPPPLSTPSNGSAPPGGSSAQPPSSERGALLSSISGFSKGGLKKTATVDKSGPKI